MDKKVYEFESLIYDAGKSGGAYVVFGIRKDIRARIKKQVGDMVAVTVVERA